MERGSMKLYRTWASCVHRLPPFHATTAVLIVVDIHCTFDTRGLMLPCTQNCGGWQHCLGTHDGSEEPLLWYDGWNSTIQPKLDNLVATSWEKHGQQEEEEGGSQHAGLLVVIAGDSTMIQQFQLLSDFARRRSDFHPVEGPNAEKIQVRGDGNLPRCFLRNDMIGCGGVVLLSW